MTPEERKAARARCEAATPGPWEIDDSQQIVWSKDGLIMYDRSDMSGDDWANGYRDDADFIAAARTDLPAALDDLDAKDKRIADLEGECERLREALEAHVFHCEIDGQRKSYCEGDYWCSRCSDGDACAVLTIPSLISAEVERVRRLEAERDDARKQNVALQRRLDLVDALSRNTDRIDRLILAAVLRTVGGRVEIPQEHLDAAGHTDFIVSAPTPDKLVVMIEQPEGPEGGDYGHL